MALRGIVAAAAIVALTAVLGAQTAPPPYTGLLITSTGTAPDQSLVYSVDTRNGAVRTLFNQRLGTLTDITMDRDNAGFAVVYQGTKGTGVHFLAREKSGVTIREACGIRGPTPNLTCLELSVEDSWVAGSAISKGAGRVGTLDPAPPAALVEQSNFAGHEVSELLIDRNEANVILALNGQSGGVIYSYQPAGASYSSTLARCPGFITDLAQDPTSGGILVSTNDPAAPFFFMDSASPSAKITTFRFPSGAFPSGAGVEAMAIDARVVAPGLHLVWAVSGDRLYVLGWDANKSTLVFPNPLLHYALPFHGASSMIFEGDRDFLMTGTVASGKNLLTTAFLRMRLGRAHAGHPYVIAASFGTQPAVPLPGNRWINLRSDPLFYLSTTDQAPEVFDQFKGTTTPDGEVTGRVTPRREWNHALKGVTFYFAGIVFDANVPGHIRTVTNSVGLTLF